MEVIDYKTEARPARPLSHPLLQDWEHISLLIGALHQKKRSQGQLSSPSHRSVLVTLWKWIGPSVVLGCTFGFRSILKPLEDYKAMANGTTLRCRTGRGSGAFIKGVCKPRGIYQPMAIASAICTKYATTATNISGSSLLSRTPQPGSTLKHKIILKMTIF
jgi:hypothetical protein